MRSSDTASPASRAQRTTSGIRRGSWVRSSVASTCGTADCMPNDTRVNPPRASSASDSGVTESGLASVVTSASSARPPGAADAVEHPDQVGRRQHRGGAATDEHRRGGPGRQPGRGRDPGAQRDLRQRRVRVGHLGGAAAELGRRVRVEVAVAAAHRAERDVQVHAEPAVARAVPHARREGAVRGSGVTLRERRAHFFFASLASLAPPASDDSAAMKASCGTSTRPMVFMRFLPSFCFSSSLRLRVMSPP